MPWVRVDDRFPHHEKCVALSDLAYALWLKAACWCAEPEHLKLEGFIPREVALTLLRSGPEAAEAAASELVEAKGLPCFGHASGLWEIASTEGGSEGWRFHDWKQYRPASYRGFEPRSEAASEAGRIGGKASAQKRKEKYGSAQPRRRSEAAPEADAEATPEAAPKRPEPKQPRSDPSKLDPDPDPDPDPGKKDPSDPCRVGNSTSDPVRRIFDHWKAEHDHPRAKLDPKRKARITAHLKTFSEDQICRAISAAKLDPFLMGENPSGKRYDGIQTLLRDPEQVERLLELGERGPNKRPPSQRQSHSDAQVERQLDRVFDLSGGDPYQLVGPQRRLPA